MKETDEKKDRITARQKNVENLLSEGKHSVTDSYSNMADKELRFKYNSLLLPKSNQEVVKSLVAMKLSYN